MNCEPLIDASAVSELLGVCEKTVVRMAKRGDIPAIKVGKCWRFRTSALNEWISAKMGVHSLATSVSASKQGGSLVV